MPKVERKEYQETKILKTVSPVRSQSSQNLSQFDSNLGLWIYTQKSHSFKYNWNIILSQFSNQIISKNCSRESEYVQKRNFLRLQEYIEIRFSLWPLANISK